MNSTVEECMRRWKTFRDRYTRELKKKTLPSGSGSSQGLEWHLFPSLEFLHDHVIPRKTVRNSAEEIRFPFNGDHDSRETADDPLSPTSCESTPSLSSQGVKRKWKFDDINKTSSEPSDNDGFGQTVINLYSCLNVQNKKKAKIHIVRYLIGLQEQELSSEN